MILTISDRNFPQSSGIIHNFGTKFYIKNANKHLFLEMIPFLASSINNIIKNIIFYKLQTIFQQDEQWKCSLTLYRYLLLKLVQKLRWQTARRRYLFFAIPMTCEFALFTLQSSSKVNWFLAAHAGGHHFERFSKPVIDLMRHVRTASRRSAWRLGHMKASGS